MADLSNTKDITTVDSTPSVAITDKIYINKGGKLQQVSLATAIESKIDSSLSKSKFAADAKATKDAISKVDSDIKALNPISETIFSNTVTFSPTAYGNAIPEQIEGYIKQDTTKGLQLFDASKMNGYTTSGVHCEVSSDGTIRTKGTLTANYLTSRHPDIIDIKQGEKYSIKIFANKTMANVYVGLTPDDGSFDAQVNFTNTENSGTFTAKSNLVDFVVGANLNGLNMDGLEFKVMITKGEPANWEPYTGGQPSPNPDYPQIVHGVGDMAFFDGEFADGGYNHTTGEPNLNANYIRSTNDICYPLKLGDRIKFVYEKPVFFAILLYDKNETITIKTSVKTSEWEYEVTKEQERFKFYINDPDGTTAMSAKRLTVTINGMYAVCVKSVGKNLFNADLFSTGTMNGVTVINNGDGSFTLKGTVTKSENICSDHFSLDYGTYNLIDYIEGNYATGSYARSQVYSSKVDGNIFISNEDASDKKSTAELKASDNYVLRFRIQEGVTYDCTLKPMLFMQGDETFVPYQSNTAYIPISAPLFDGDQIIKRNGEYKLRRKWGMVVFDGSEDESWKRYTADYFALKLPFQVSETHKGYCDRFMWELYENFSSDLRAGVSKLSFLWVTYKSIDTEENFKTWLQSHPISVVYQLAEPTEESLSPEAQKAIHSIMACDELTTLEIVGVPEDAEIQNQFLLPRNIDGALNTTAYCTAKRNEIALEELVAQSLDARVNKLEVDNESLNLQTLIVE